MNRPKILFIAPSAYILSGLATWLDYMEPGLREMGWAVTIGLVEGHRYHRPEAYLEKHCHKNWVAIDCESQTHEGRLRAIAKVLHQEQPDIIATVNMPDAIVGAVRWRQQQNKNLKIVMTVHGIQPDMYEDIEMYSGWLDAVCCTNRLACDLALHLGKMSPERVHYVPYGIGEIATDIDDRSKPDRLTIAYVGRLEQDQKRVHDLPAILSALDDGDVPYHLLIAGTGPEEDSLRTELQAHLAAGDVSFLGFLQPDELQVRVLAQSDALLLTSSWETGPLVIWEAMANSVAVVSSRYIGSGLEGALIHGENALMFDVGDTAVAAQQLRELYDDKTLSKCLGEHGHEVVKERYSIPVSMKNWNSELRSILSAKPKKIVQDIVLQSSPGRLSRVFGEHLAENIRQQLQLKGPDTDAGGEWPHSHGKTPYHDKEFWNLVEKLDRRIDEVH